MNMIEQQICDAIEIIVDRAIEQANYDKTIQATVISCVDATIGKYKVKYQDSTFYAYSGNSEVTYTNGSTVYILIPGNNTEADKTILGTTKKLGINYVATVEGDEAYQIVGNNCIINSSDSFNLQSYRKNKQVKVLYSKQYTVNQNLINLNKTAINEYIKNQQTIICGAVVRTALPAEQQFRGNYGLIFALNFTDNTNNSVVTRYYTVDVDKMRGNPYKILYDTRQYGIFDIDGKNFIDVDSISIFCYDFPNIKPDSQCIDDIFIKDIELCGAERLSDDDISNYSLTFHTPQGIYFDSSSLISDTRSIEAQVRVKGKVIDNKSQQLPFYWFIEHVGITSESTYYNKFGGQGWKCLNNYNVIKKATETDPEVVEWIPSSYKWTVSKRDIIAKEVKYKCAVVYDGTVITKTIVIKNLASGYNITIDSDEGTKFYFDIGYPTLKCLVNGKENNDLTYSWAVTNNVGNFESIADTPDINKEYLVAWNNYYTLLDNIQKELVPLEPNRDRLNWYRAELLKYDKIMRVDRNTIWHLNVNTITDFSTYQCTVYQGNLYLGTASIVLTNSLTAEGSYNMIIHDGSCVFKYDENGVSPASNAVDTPIEIKALTFSVYDNLGNRIDDEIVRHSNIQWIIPIENTMIKIPNSYEEYEEDLERGVRIYKNFMSFAYEIQDRYDITKNNNDIQVMINYKNMNLSAKTDLVFTKEGDAGTNGTEFFCRIVPNTISGREVPMYPTLTELSDYSWSLNYLTQQANRFFRVQLWHNETKVLDSVTSARSTEGKQATIKWSILQNKYNAGVLDSSGLIVNENTGIFTYSGYRNDSPAHIVKAELEYDGVVYYATIPLITVKIRNNNYRVNLKEGTGFVNAVYSSDGKRPRYDNSYPFELTVVQKINGYDEDISLKTTSTYAVTYEWRYLGRIYEKSWLNDISLGDRVLELCSQNQKAVKPLDDYDGQCVTNAIEGIVKKSGTEIARIHIPVHLMLNRYGNSAINGWDGNSVNIDKNGGFILAPQVGAGIKENDNSFTGVIIGKVKETNQSGDDIGLIGYAKGVRSIFLDARTGKAVFGANGKGQITIDPTQNTARIYSGNFVYKPDGTGTGMEIDLTTPQIRFGSGNFEVNKEGHLTAKGGGSIAGWQITNTELYSPAPYTNRKITLDSKNTKIYSGVKTTLDSNTVGFHLSPEGLGLVSSGGGKILMKTNTNTPVIYSNNHNSLTSTAVGFYLSQDGLSLRSSYNKDGSTVTSSLVFSTTGEPEIYSNSKNRLDNTRNGFYLSGSGLSIGSKFYVDNTGVVRVGNGAVAKTSKHWEINGNSSNSYIKYGNMGDTNSVYISTGMISLGKKFYVDNTGVVRVGNGAVSANGKYWTIDGGSESYIGYNANASYITTDSNKVSVGDSAQTSSVYLGTDGIRLGKKFAVDRQGNMLAKYITATGGTIGGWLISSNKLSATDGHMELRSNGTLKGGSSYEWSINSAGTATFNRIKADKGGTIGNCTITENGIHSSSSQGTWYINANGSASFNNITASGGRIGGCTISNSSIYTGSWRLNSDGSASFANVTITGGSLTIGAASINSAGHAKFTDVEVTGGSIKLGGTTLNSDGTNLTAGKTTVGNESLPTYIKDLVVDTLTADKVTINSYLNVTSDNGGYLRIGANTTHPEVSGINIGPKGVRLNNEKSGQRYDGSSSIKFISRITGLGISVGHSSIAGISTPLISSITVTLSYMKRELNFYDGILYEATSETGDSKSDTDS